MKRILRIDASARQRRSLTRTLGNSFEERWQSLRPEDTWERRDLAQEPPAHICDDWIVAAFTPDEDRSPEQEQLLAPSERMIEELAAADVIVLTTPMYNYGLPSTLKAWIDNVVRKDRTFSFDLERGDWPLDPLLAGKELVVLTACGEFGFEPGGARDGMDHLLPHLETLREFLGAATMHVVRIEYQEFGDRRYRASLKAGRADARELAERLAMRVPELQ
uniref:FMN-dependent NADH-azoreductase n=1 Tax=Stappia sp. TaxID=1870903 RepID=UPI003BAB512D